MPELETLIEAAALPYIPALAELRIRVFREWPYLYDGDLNYEQQYLYKFIVSAQNTLVLVTDAGRIVGASTALPLASAEQEFQSPFIKAGLDPHDWYYFGESVLLPEYRGFGWGKKFFAAREARAKALGFDQAAFCAVERKHHQLQPGQVRVHDAFWQSQGFIKQNHLRCEFSWKDIDEETETKKQLVFWTKELS